MKRYLPFIIVAVVALLTLSAGTMLYRSKRAPLLKLSQNQSASGKEISGHVRGNARASVTLEEYGDFECPPCGKLAGPLAAIEREFGEQFRMVFHNFPLITHQHAREAACAAEAAGQQNRFWEMHDLLYREQGMWSKANDTRAVFMNYAGVLGLNREQFGKDIDSERVKALVSADEEYGKSLGVTNTPTIFINGTMVPPTSLNPTNLRAAINEAIRKTKAKEKPL